MLTTCRKCGEFWRLPEPQTFPTPKEYNQALDEYIKHCSAHAKKCKGDK